MKTNIVSELFSVIFLLLLIAISTLSVAFNGINWSDSAQIFYFGNKILNGSFPYRDFSYQTGFIPLWTDFLFQKWFGQMYLSSLAVGIALKTTTLLVVYAMFRQYSSRLISILIVTALSLLHSDLIDGGNDYWSNFFLISCAAFSIFGFRSAEKKSAAFCFFFSGFFLSLVMVARQTCGVACLLIVSTVMILELVRNSKHGSQYRLSTYFAGLISGYLLILGFLAVHRAIEPAWSELFVAAAEKKHFILPLALMDAFSGGTVFTASLSNAILKTGFCNLIPLAVILGSFISDGFLFRSEKTEKTKCPISLILVPSLMMIGWMFPEVFRVVTGNDNASIQNISDFLTYDFPRVFLTILLILTFLIPKRTESFFGVPISILSVSTAITLGSVWAMQMSWMGRGYVKTRLLMIFILLMMIMSARISVALKKRFSGIFLAAAVTVFFSQFLTHSLGQEGIHTGFYKPPQYEIDHSMLRSIKISKEKVTLFSFLKQQISPGDSCFIYGSAPILYLMLECTNPTNLDITYSDSLTLQSARKAIILLKKNPPKWIVETGTLRFLDDESPRITPVFPGPSDQPGPRELRSAMRELIQSYRLIARTGNQNSNQGQWKMKDLDHVSDYRLYQHQ